MPRKADQMPYLDVSIQLRAPAGLPQPYVPSFTTGDQINGIVLISARCDVAFEDLRVHLTGEEATTVHGAAPERAHHQFLEISRSYRDSALLPVPAVFRTGRKYTFPFQFTFVDALPLASCLHMRTNPLDGSAHVQLPPSLGDASIAGFGGKLCDDAAPPGCRIAYKIQTTLEQTSLRAGKVDKFLLAAQKIRFMPSTASSSLPMPLLDPPADNRSETDLEYAECQTSSGRLFIALHSPACFRLPLRDRQGDITRPARLTLTCVPTNQLPTASHTPFIQGALPRLKSIKGQIMATTLYTTNVHENSLVSPYYFKKKKSFSRKPLNFSDKAVPLSIPCPRNLEWSYHSPTQSSLSLIPSTGTRVLPVDQGFYTAAVVVPVTLSQANFIPTFNSCFISRIYSLQLHLKITQGRESPLQTMTVIAPIEIVAEDDRGPPPSYNASLGLHIPH